MNKKYLAIFGIVLIACLIAGGLILASDQFNVTEFEIQQEFKWIDVVATQEFTNTRGGNAVRIIFSNDYGNNVESKESQRFAEFIVPYVLDKFEEYDSIVLVFVLYKEDIDRYLAVSALLLDPKIEGGDPYLMPLFVEVPDKDVAEWTRRK